MTSIAYSDKLYNYMLYEFTFDLYIIFIDRCAHIWVTVTVMSPHIDKYYKYTQRKRFAACCASHFYAFCVQMTNNYPARVPRMLSFFSSFSTYVICERSERQISKLSKTNNKALLKSIKVQPACAACSRYVGTSR